MASLPKHPLSRAAHWLKDIVTAPPQREGALDDAYRQLLEGKPRQALTAFQIAANQQPDLVPALEGIGWCLLDLDEPLSAETWFTRALALAPGSPAAARGLEQVQQGRYKPLSDAWQTYHSGDLAGALSQFEAGSSPDSAPTGGERWRHLVGAAWCLYGLGRYEQALERFQLVLERIPDHVPAQEGIGFCCFFLRRFDEGREALQAALKLQGDRRDAYSFLGWIELEEDQNETALERFTQAHELDIRCGDPLYGMGWSHLRLGHLEQACERFLEGARLDPFHVSIGGLVKETFDRERLDPKVLRSIAWARYRQSRADLALALFDLFEERDMASVADRVGRAASLIRMERYDEGADILEGIEGLESVDCPVVEGEYYPEDRLVNSPWSLLGWCRYHQGREDEALSHFLSCLERDPERINLLTGAGWSYLKLGRLEDGARAFMAADRIDTSYVQCIRGNQSARRRLEERSAPAFELLEAGKIKEAIPLLVEALKHEPYPDRAERLERTLRWAQEQADSSRDATPADTP